MKKTLLFLIAFVCLGITLKAQDSLVAAKDTAWRVGGNASLQFSQVALSSWAAGGENSMSLTAIVSGFASYLEGKNYWNSYGLFTYGAYQGQYDTKIRKNVDLIDIGTKAGHELGNKFYLSGLLNFKSVW